MSRPTILLADNNPDYRRSLRVLLEPEDYQVEEAASVQEAKEKLEAIPVDLALVDLRLTSDAPNDLSGLEVVKELDSGIPWTLLTAYETVPAKAMEELSSNSKLRIRFREGGWFWVKPSDPNKLMHLVRAMASPTILHISDLHFEPSKRYEIGLNKLLLDLRDLKAEFGVRPNVVIVSGDIAHQCLRGTFSTAERFLHNLSKEINTPIDHFVLVPGNHDVNRAAAQEQYRNFCARGREEIDIANDLFSSRFGRYSQFYRQFYHGRRGIPTKSRPFDIFDLHNWGVVIIAFNSCLGEMPQKGNPREWISKGQIGTRQLNSAISELQRLRQQLSTEYTRPLLSLIAFHHHCIPNPDSDQSYLQDFEQLLVAFERLKPLAILHGHRHKTSPQTVVELGGNPILVFATGSIGLGAKGEQLQYTVIQFRLAPGYRSKLFLRRYDPQAKRSGDPTPGSWVADRQTVHTADTNGIVPFTVFGDDGKEVF